MKDQQPILVTANPRIPKAIPFWKIRRLPFGAAARARSILLALILIPVTYATNDFTFSVSGGTATLTGYLGETAEVTIPNRFAGVPVTSISEHAFLDNDFVTHITFGDHVTSIGQEAFRDCELLEHVLLPPSLKEIGDYAFAYCESLANIEIPANLTVLGNGAFSGAALTSIAIPDRVTSVGHYAFDDCYFLNTVIIGNGVESIGVNAFSHNSNLAELSLPPSVTSIGDHAFSSCTNLQSVTIGNGLQTIDYKAFTNCTKLRSVFFEGDAPTFADSVFSGSAGVALFRLPNTTGWEEQSASLWYPYSYDILDNEVVITGYSGAARDITLPATISNLPVTSIASTAFNGNPTIKRISLPDSIATIATGAFSDCPRLRDILASAANPAFSSRRGVLYNNDFTTLVRYPASRRGPYYIPLNIQTIASEAFSDAVHLTALTLRDGLTTIESEAFRSCKSLTEITIPSSVTSIGDLAFSHCDSLSRIRFDGNAPALGSMPFQSLPVDAYAYYLPDATGWSATYGGVKTAIWSPDDSFQLWIAGYQEAGTKDGPNDDPDGDGQVNALENLFGTDPTKTSTGIDFIKRQNDVLLFQHLLNATPANDLEVSYEWGTDLETFYADGSPNLAGTTTVYFTSTSTPRGLSEVSATIVGQMQPENIFVRIRSALRP